jgi:hypothetical protein
MKQLDHIGSNIISVFEKRNMDEYYILNWRDKLEKCENKTESFRKVNQLDREAKEMFAKQIGCSITELRQALDFVTLRL